IKKMTRFSFHRTFVMMPVRARARDYPPKKVRYSMDLTRFEISRRTALLTSAAIAANVINPMRAFAQETPRKGGVFNVHYGAEQRQPQPEPATLDRRLHYRRKDQGESGRPRQRGQDSRRARRKLGGLARWQDHPL